MFFVQSIVLHKLELSAQKSSFPTALGLRVTGVDDSTYSLTGDAYSAIAMPSADTHVSRVLQEDDTSLGAPHALELKRPDPWLTVPVCVRSLRVCAQGNPIARPSLCVCTLTAVCLRSSLGIRRKI